MKTKEQILEMKKLYYQKNKERILHNRRLQWKVDKDLLKRRNKVYYQRNKSSISKRGKTYYQQNKPRIISRVVEYDRRRIKIDINYKLRKRLKARMKLALLRNYISGSAIQLLGCSVHDFRRYLEKKFTAGMSWKNYGLWHIDHIIPCCSFDLTKIEEQQKCFHYTNQQPLWATDNLRKGTSSIF